MKSSLKTLSIGFVAGAICMLTTSVVADSFNVTAKIANDTFFKVDGEIIAPPSDQPVLYYNDRVYVPIRFLGETLGCDVDWDIPTRKVIIDTVQPDVIEKEVEVIKEVPLYLNSDDNPNNKVTYSQLPIRKSDGNYYVEILGITRSTADNSTKILVNIKNTSSYPVQLLQGDSRLIVDGEEYDLHALRAEWDQRWYRDIQYDQEEHGYLMFEQIPEDYKKINLLITVSYYDGIKANEKVIEFNFVKD